MNKVKCDHATIQLEGELSQSNATELRKQLTEVASNFENVDIDLRFVSFADSTILGLFTSFHRLVTASGGQFRLLNPPKYFSVLLNLTKLDTIIKVVGNIDSQKDLKV